MNKWLSVSALCLASVSTCALAAVYELPRDGSAVVGTDSRIEVGHEDMLFDVARQYGLGYPEIVRANPGVDIWLPGEGREILLPGRHILPPRSARCLPSQLGAGDAPMTPAFGFLTALSGHP